MLTVEEAFELTLIEEGQYLLGEDFITQTLGFSWDQIAKVFYKSIREYARCKHIVEIQFFRTRRSAVLNKKGI